MSDVFISYAREDRDRAAQLAGALGARGWSVWWDRKILVGKAFDQAIEHELENAKCVVVLWSEHSVGSEWVKNEAAAAAERGVLAPARIEDVKLPLEFRRKQTADLTDWNGEPSHGGFQELCEGIASTIGGAPPQQAVRERGGKPRWNPRWALAVVAIIAVAVWLGISMVSPSEGGKRPGAGPGPADLVTGAYLGEVTSDSKGSSRSNIEVRITKVDRYTVRVTSAHRRLGAVEVRLKRTGNKIRSDGGDSPLEVDLSQNPATLDFYPRTELAYRGTKQK